MSLEEHVIAENEEAWTKPHPTAREGKEGEEEELCSGQSYQYHEKLHQ